MTWAAYNVASIAQDHSVVWKAIIQNGRDTLKTLGSSSFYELFDLTADPGESTPVDISETSQDLHETFKKWLRKERTAPSY